MPVPTTHLYELWPCNEGSGDVAHGAIHAIDLALRRFSPWDFGAGIGLEVDAASGWDVEFIDGHPDWSSGLTIYNGNGVAMIPAGVLKLDAEGDGFTLMARLTPGWVKADGPPFQTLAGGVMDVCGATGRYSYGPALTSGVGAENVAVEGTHIGKVIQHGSTDGLPQEMATDAPAQWLPIAATLTVKRVNGLDAPNDCEAKFYWNDVLAATLEVQSAHIDLTRISFGSLFNGSFGAFRQAALFTHALEGDDLPDGPDDVPLDPPDDGDTGDTGGPGSNNPWLNPDGSRRLIIEWPQPNHKSFVNNVLDSEGDGGRQTRSVSEYGGAASPRRYRLSFKIADRAMLGILLEGIAVTRGGAKAMRWRHPVDDAPGTVVSAPRWRITNAGEVERAIGAQSATVEVEIEEMP